MKSLGRVLNAAMLIVSAATQVCTSNDEYGYFTISQQAELDRLAQGCTTLDGHLGMSANYSGRFYLPGIRNITGTIDWFWEDPPHNLTEVDLPDLEYLGGDVGISYTTPGPDGLKSLKMPKLKSIRNLALNYATEVDLDSLQEAGSIKWEGNFTSVSFKSLRRVHGSFIFCVKDCYMVTTSASVETKVQLPVLEEVGGGFEIYGNISSLAVPKLATVGAIEDQYESHKLVLFFFSQTQPIDISFPELSFLGDSLDITSRFKSLDLPSLRNTTSSIWIQPDTDPLHINLPLESVRGLYPWGEISGVNLPNLHQFKSVWIRSYHTLDCDTIEDVILMRSGSSDNEYDTDILCDAPKPAISGPGLTDSNGSQLVIGLCCGLGGGAALISAGYFVWRRRRNTRKKTMMSDTTSVELPAYHRVVEEPPAYSARTESSGEPGDRNRVPGTN